MSAPRRESAKAPAAVGSYLLECKLKRAYEALLNAVLSNYHQPGTRQAACVQLLGGNLADTQVRHAETRLRDGMLTLLLRLTATQQEVMKPLLVDNPDLPAAIQQLVAFERNINYRDEDPALKKDDDDWKVKASGLGKFRPRLGGGALAQQQRRLARESQPIVPLGPPLVLEPARPRPVLRTKKRGRRKPQVVLRGQLAIEWSPVSFAGGWLSYGSL